MKDMQKLMKEAQKMQANMMAAQEKLGELTVDTSSGGGAVKLTMTGHLDIIDLKIDKDAMDPDDTEMLEEMIMVAVNDGIKQAKEIANKKMEEVAGPLAGGMKGGGQLGF